MFEIVSTAIPGLKSISTRALRDDRGSFMKLFHQDAFLQSRLGTHFSEIYMSTSRRGVVRGMHFQLPPHHHDKLVYCISGKVLDVVLDLRTDSPEFQRCAGFELSDRGLSGLYVPKGCAHGFAALTDSATMLYLVETMYAPEADSGVRWDSIDFDWPEKSPTVSSRDQTLPTLENFDSPFKLHEF